MRVRITDVSIVSSNGFSPARLGCHRSGFAARSASSSTNVADVNTVTVRSVRRRSRHTASRSATRRRPTTIAPPNHAANTAPTRPRVKLAPSQVTVTNSATAGTASPSNLATPAPASGNRRNTGRNNTNAARPDSSSNRNQPSACHHGLPNVSKSSLYVPTDSFAATSSA